MKKSTWMPVTLAQLLGCSSMQLLWRSGELFGVFVNSNCFKGRNSLQSHGESSGKYMHAEPLAIQQVNFCWLGDILSPACFLMCGHHELLGVDGGHGRDTLRSQSVVEQAFQNFSERNVTARRPKGSCLSPRSDWASDGLCLAPMLPRRTRWCVGCA